MTREGQIKVGDMVWVARCGSRLVKQTCPICYGDKEVTLILGNKEKIVIECDYCGKGYGFPRGFVEEYEYTEAAERVAVSAIRMTSTIDGECIEYTLSGYFSTSIDDIFDTEEEAIERCKIISKRETDEQNKRIDYIKKNARKTFAWNAGYWMSAAKRARKDAEQYESKAVLCNNRGRDAQ